MRRVEQTLSQVDGRGRFDSCHSLNWPMRKQISPKMRPKHGICALLVVYINLRSYEMEPES